MEDQAKRTPDAIAILADGRTVTYATLNRQADQLAHALRRHGVGLEERVGLCGERSPDMLVGLLGILKAGGAYVPLNPAYPRERLAHILNDAEIRVVVTQHRLLADLPITPSRTLCLDRDWPLIAQEEMTPLVSGVRPDNAAYLIYTSGSTGRPKGVVMLEHPQIRDTVVTAQEDGSGGKRLVAYVVGRHGNPFDVAALRSFLKERLPEYMVPSAFVFLTALPLTSNGKVDRKALPPPDAGGHLRNRYIAPRTCVEKMLAEIWTDLLRVPKIGVHDDFFDLGGHSLLAIQLMHRVQKSVGRSLSLTAIFQAPTVAKLAALLSSASSSASSPLVALPAAGSRPPLYCFDPTGRHIGAYHALARSLDGERPVYGLELGYLFQQNWTEVSVRSIAERHANVICEHQREGPYYLLGWSLGGVIALAVARVLEQRKQPVAFLGILDTQARTSLYDHEDVDALEELAEFLNHDRRKEFCALPSSERDALRSRLMGLPVEERIEHAVRWATGKGFLPGDIPMETLKLRYALLKDAAVMLHGYRGRPLDVPVHVWWTEKTLERYGTSPIHWQDYTTGMVWSDIIPGII